MLSPELAMNDEMMINNDAPSTWMRSVMSQFSVCIFLLRVIEVISVEVEPYCDRDTKRPTQ